MKYIISAALAVTASLNAQAEQQCTVDAQVLKASYSQQQGAQSAQPFDLWRLNQQVAHQSHAQHIAELWQQLPNGQVRPIRYFEKYQRAIEYQPSELKHQGQAVNWSQKYQLVHPQLLAQDYDTQTGEGCELEQHYTYKKGNQKLSLVWLPELKLVKKLTTSVQHDDGHWHQQGTLELVSYSADADEVAAQFKQWDTYQSTDYADVGDNEHDPFLAKMINQGFIEHGGSGFYDQHGHAIGGHHH